MKEIIDAVKCMDSGIRKRKTVSKQEIGLNQYIYVYINLENGGQRATQKVLQNLVHLPCQTWTILPKQILHVIHQEASQIQFLLPQSVLATLHKIRIIRFSHSSTLTKQELIPRYRTAP